MKQFHVTVTKTSKYIVNIDETIWDDEQRKNWSETFFEIDDLEDMAEKFAVSYQHNDEYYHDMSGLNIIETSEIIESEID